VLLEATAPWAAFFGFTIRPIVPTDKSPAIFDKATAWRDSIRRPRFALSSRFSEAPERRFGRA
jgi:hypothetical protein